MKRMNDDENEWHEAESGALNYLARNYGRFRTDVYLFAALRILILLAIMAAGWRFWYQIMLVAPVTWLSPVVPVLFATYVSIELSLAFRRVKQAEWIVKEASQRDVEHHG